MPLKRPVGFGREKRVTLSHINTYIHTQCPQTGRPQTHTIHTREQAHNTHTMPKESTGSSTARTEGSMEALGEYPPARTEDSMEAFGEHPPDIPSAPKLPSHNTRPKEAPRVVTKYIMNFLACRKQHDSYKGQEST